MAVDCELIAPCGIYCAVCPLYLARTDEQLARTLAERMQTTPDKVPCSGCRPAQGSPTPLRGQTCVTYSCATQKAVTYCHECEDFPCRCLAPTADRANVLPHNIKVFSLLTLKRDGEENWVREYDLIWQRYFRGRMGIGEGPVLPEEQKK